MMRVKVRAVSRQFSQHNRFRYPTGFLLKHFSSSSSSSSTPLSKSSSTRLPKDGLSLKDFLQQQNEPKVEHYQSDGNGSSPTASTAPAYMNHHPHTLDDDNNNYNNNTSSSPSPPTLFHLKTYGCQMNVSDSDIVRSLLLDAGLHETTDEHAADVLLTNTCAIRENAEQKVWQRLRDVKKRNKLVGVLGCMAERLKHDLLQDGLADLVVGPDAYRDLPHLIPSLLHRNVETAVNVQLSLDETYADVRPTFQHKTSAFVSVMRGCNNMCSYCVVPFTRGRERSRPYTSVLDECKTWIQEYGVKEIVLLGQNVNSYHDKSNEAVAANPATDYSTSNTGFTNLFQLRGGAGHYFSDLVEAVSDLDPEVRVRFTSPHPKDYPPELLQLMQERPNVCNQLHMPAQSGSTSVLHRMRRGYSREAYLELLDNVRTVIPDVAISSDFIAGFCQETDDEHADTISLLETVRFDQAFMFAYSMREKTHAHRKLQDNVPAAVKQERLQQIIDTFRRHVHERNEQVEVGRLRLVLMEGESKKSKPELRTWSGRTDQNKRIVFPYAPCVDMERNHEAGLTKVNVQEGEYGVVHVTEAKGHTLRGELMGRTTLARFAELTKSLEAEEGLKQELKRMQADTLGQDGRPHGSITTTMSM